VVDSTAAGDAFTGGVLFALAQQGTDREQLASLNSRNWLEQALTMGMRCGAFAVSRKGAFDALPTLADLNP